MRRAKESDDRVAAELRRDELQHEIGCGGEWFGRERQGVEGLIRDAGAAEHFARQIQIRQRPFEYDGDAIQRLRPSERGWGGLDPPRDGDEFVLTIAVDEERPFRRANWCEQRRRAR